MKKTLTSLFLLLIFGSISAQTIDDLSLGTDNTLDIITWNIEWFPKNGQTTINYVKDIIINLEPDVIAIQEISDTVQFNLMMNNLASDGYIGYYYSSYFAGLGYIYNENTVLVNDIYEIYTSYPYWSPFPRSPMVMELTFMEKDFIIMNNHFKCCGDGDFDINDDDDEENRRFVASNLLKEYIDDNFDNDNVIVLGDLNDEITDNESNNVFQNIIDDTENYLFADMDIAEGSSSNWSYPDWPSHLDHIFVTNEFFAALDDENTIVQTIKIDDYMGGFYNYENNVSDHRPVGLKLDPTSIIQPVFNNELACNFDCYPIPANNYIFINSNNSSKIEKIKIFDNIGRIISIENIQQSDKKIKINTSNFENGIYFAQIYYDTKLLTVKKIIIQH